MQISDNAIARRKFLQFLATSPLLAYSGSLTLARELLDPDLENILSHTPRMVDTPDQAINIFELEAVARKNLPPAHYGYIATGVGDESAQIANREGFKKIQLRMRRLVDVRNIDTSVELFGVKWPSPLGIAPCGSHKAFHPLGEIAVANAAKARNSLMMLSTAATTSIEDVNRAREEPVWFQLYPLSDLDGVKSMIRRAEKAGCPVLAITVDSAGGIRQRETLEYFIGQDQRDCTACHGADGYPSAIGDRPNLAGYFKPNGLRLDGLTWEFIQRIRDFTAMKIVLKGIVTAEDARLCLQHGVDGIVVSNHGGRQESTNRGSIESLPEVLAAVNGKIPVMMDGGIRRGADIFKALALGATKVFIGRPYLWGLGAFGQAGVERTLDILNQELLQVMKQAGTPNINSIDNDYLVSSRDFGPPENAALARRAPY